MSEVKQHPLSPYKGLKIAEGRPQTQYAKTKGIYSAETTSMLGPTILQNGNPRQRHTCLLIGLY